MEGVPEPRRGCHRGKQDPLQGDGAAAGDGWSRKQRQPGATDPWLLHSPTFQSAASSPTAEHKSRESRRLASPEMLPVAPFAGLVMCYGRAGDKGAGS